MKKCACETRGKSKEKKEKNYMKPIELMRCRLCGSPARRVERGGSNWVECTGEKCGMRTPNFARGAEAVKRWNAANAPAPKKPPKKRPEHSHGGGRR